MELDNEEDDEDVQPLTFIKDVQFESALYGTFHITHVRWVFSFFRQELLCLKKEKTQRT